jgi:hypothetical protein
VGQGQAPVLGPSDVEALIARLGSFKDEIVLIGGQALNFWAERFMSRSAELRAGAPHTSKDIDFFGSQKHVRRCAELLGGESTTYGPRDRTPCAGVVRCAGIEIDFVHTLSGVRSEEIREMSIAFEHIRVMHPVHVLESRVANVVELHRTEALALKQLRTAIVVMLEFQRTLIDANKSRHVDRLCARVLKLAKSRQGLAVFREHGIDVFDAASCDPRMPEKYRTERYPRMRAELNAERARRT